MSYKLKLTDEAQKQLFVGKCKFEKNQITVSVTNDNANIFEGDFPTIVFEKEKDGTDRDRQRDG